MNICLALLKYQAAFGIIESISKEWVKEMNNINDILDVVQNAWPTIQPAISTVFSTVIASLFLRPNTAKSEFTKLKQAKFSNVADKLLEDGYITHLEYYKCRNFNKIAQKADEVYKKQIDSSSQSPDSFKKNLSIDWFIRFFEDCGNISDEQMQELWAKVLAGETAQPGTYSLRILDVLRNLSKDEAEALQTLASYAIPVHGQYYICVDDELKNSYDYDFKLLTAYDCNTIENNIATQYEMTINAEDHFMSVGNIICLPHIDSEERYILEIQRFTKIGHEFIRLVSPNEKYHIDFFAQMKKKHPNLNLTAYYITKMEGNQITFNNVTLI